MTSLTETIKAFEQAREAFAPFQRALNEQVLTAIKTIQRVGRERRLYGGAWEFGWLMDVGWVSVGVDDIGEDCIYIEYDTGEYRETGTLFFDVIENAESRAVAAADAAGAKYAQELEEFRAAKRADLQRQLAELDR